jgi:hypothetical protein
MMRALIAVGLFLLAPSVAAAQTWAVALTCTSNGGDGFIIRRRGVARGVRLGSRHATPASWPE